jgi:hypothetical protein
MRRKSAIAASCLLMTLVAMTPLAVAQQKTVSACRAEWQANKAANQAAGITEKAYVAQCRGGAAPAQTTAAPATPPPAPAAAPSAAGQKTVSACRAEWRANKAANQAAGISEKAYVAQCRGGAAPAQTTAAPAAPPPAAPAAAPSGAGQKTVSACRAEWRANKAANQVAGITEKAYVAQCRSGAAPGQTTAAPAGSAAAPTASPAPTAAPPAGPPAPTAATSPNPIPAPAKPSALAPNQLGTNEFTTEAQAKARCPADTVVWANLPSRIYHFTGTRYYGETNKGAYMCERDAVAAGMRAAKNETHP